MAQMRGPLEEERADLVYITELPEFPRPMVTQYRVWVCHCMVWGSPLRGQHPAVAPARSGATAHRVGARVMAAAHALHYGLVSPVRKVPLVLAALTDICLTHRVMPRNALQRTAGAVGMAYAQLRAMVPETPVAHTDDTGWRVGGESAHLMAFETEAPTFFYQSYPHHRHEKVQDVIPAGYSEVLVTDRRRSYDVRAFDWADQRTCLTYILRSLSDVVERETGPARECRAWLKPVVQDVLALWHEDRDGQVADCKLEIELLQAGLTYQLRDRRLKDRDNRLLNELGWHHDRGPCCVSWWTHGLRR